VKYNDVTTLEKRLRADYEALNKLAKMSPVTKDKRGRDLDAA
jgi:hypothetical protein